MLRPALYEQHRLSQLYGSSGAGGVSRAGISAADAAGMPGYMGKQTLPAPSGAPAEPTHPSVVELQKQVGALEAQGLPHSVAVGKVLASPEGLELRKRYYADNPQHQARG
jgi:hypothetical protein